MVSSLSLPLTSPAVRISTMKKIFTHINPDLDAVASCWLLKRFLSGWEDAQIVFIEANASTLADGSIDNEPDILYVDVGRGKLDHHQTGEDLSATRLCWEYIKNKRGEKELSKLELSAVEELVEVVNEVDNAHDLSWAEVSETRYHFQLHAIIGGLRGLGKKDPELVSFGFDALDAVLLNIKSRIRASEDLKKGTEFTTPWGKGIALESGNQQVLWVGETSGYVIVVKKDKETGVVKIYSRYNSSVDLTKAYNKFKEMDPESDWFLHAGKRLLLNQSSVNPNMRPTILTLDQIIEVLKR